MSPPGCAPAGSARAIGASPHAKQIFSTPRPTRWLHSPPAARGVDCQFVPRLSQFDVYEGAGLAEDRKSLAILVTLQPQEATLTYAEIEAFSRLLVSSVEKATGGTLRG